MCFIRPINFLPDQIDNLRDWRAVVPPPALCALVMMLAVRCDGSASPRIARPSLLQGGQCGGGLFVYGVCVCVRMCACMR